MSFEGELRAHILGSDDVSAVVADRVHPMVIPQGAGPGVGVPAITYTVIFGEPENSLDGFTSGVTRYAVQIDCWSEHYAETVQLALALRDRMNVEASTFKSVITEFPALDDYEPDTKRYRRSVSVSCRHTEVTA